MRVVVADRRPAHLAALPDRHRRCLPDPPQDVERRRVGHGLVRTVIASTGMSAPVGAGCAGAVGSATSMPVTSGAAASIASLTAVLQRARSSRRTRRSAEQPQPDRPVLVDAEQLDVAAVRAQVRPGRLQRPLHPLGQRVGMQVVHDQQPGHQLVGRQLSTVDGGRSGRDDLDQPLQPGAVEVDDEPHQLLGPLAGRAAGRTERVRELLDALPGRARVAHAPGPRRRSA